MKDKQFDTKNSLAGLSIGLSIILGLLYIVLFCWQAPGISYPIFFLLALSANVVPIALTEPARLKDSKWSLLLLPFVLLLSCVFVYRLNSSWLTLAFITLPFIFSIYYASVHIRSTLQNFSILNMALIPLKLMVAWLSDILGLLRNISRSQIFVIPRGLITARTRKILTGFILAVPFVIVFAVLLGSADIIFGRILKDIVANTFGRLFDLLSLPNLIAKGAIATIIAVYYAVFNFSLWNRDSTLKKFMDRNTQAKVGLMTRSWDPIIVSSFLGALNLLFVGFVVIQFLYLFGGTENVLGESATFTYAEYARRGFWELMFVSILVYGIIYITTYKTSITNVRHSFLYHSSMLLLVLCIIVITYSAHLRLSLYESIYGFTTLRLFVHFVIACIALLYFALLTSPIFRNPQRFISFATALLLSFAYLILLVVPGDYIVAKLNHTRYLKTGNIDLLYILSLSDEVVPVLIDLSAESSVKTPSPEPMSSIIKANIAQRIQNYEKSRTSWQSYNLWGEWNKSLVDQSGILQTNWEEKVDNSLQEFIEDYSAYLVDGNFEDAYALFWSARTEPTEFVRLAEDYNLVIYSYLLDCDFSAKEIWREYDTFTAFSLFYERDVLIFTSFVFWHNNIQSKVYETGLSAHNSVKVSLENGTWKIVSSDSLMLGYQPDRWLADSPDIAKLFFEFPDTFSIEGVTY